MMTRIERRIEDARAATGNQRAKAHRAVLKELGKLDGQKMNIIDVALAFNYLRDEIEKRAAQKKRFFTDEFGRDLIDERRFPVEMKILRTLLTRFAYSQTLYDWFAKKRHAFARELAHDRNFQATLERWPTMSPGGRLAAINEVVRRRLEFFGDSDFRFQMPKVDVADLSYSRAVSTASSIFFDRNTLAEPEPTDILRSAYHETTHVLLAQLGLQYFDGKVSIDHPLYEDIISSANQNGFQAFSGDRFPELYKNDSEERLCNHDAYRFIDELENGTGLRARFRVAGTLWQETLRGHPPSLRDAIDTLKLT